MRCRSAWERHCYATIVRAPTRSGRTWHELRTTEHPCDAFSMSGRIARRRPPGPTVTCAWCGSILGRRLRRSRAYGVRRLPAHRAASCARAAEARPGRQGHSPSSFRLGRDSQEPKRQVFVGCREIALCRRAGPVGQRTVVAPMAPMSASSMIAFIRTPSMLRLYNS